MFNFDLISNYFIWHYSSAIASFFRILANFVWFIFHFFSIGILFKTLFTPFERMKETKKRGFDIKDWFSVLLVNIMMRLIGFFVRMIFIIIGFLSEIFILAAGTVSLVIWVFMPAVILSLLVLGITLLF